MSPEKNNRPTSRHESSPRKGLVRRAISRLSRYSEILAIFLRYGFGDLVRKVDADVYRRLRGRQGHLRRKNRAVSRPQALRFALEELGPTFIKIGQLLSHRPDLLPPDWLEELEKLRGSVPPISYDDVRMLIHEDLGDVPETVFKEFSRDPIASASIAQVHRAVLHTGEYAAVKVQRPGIRPVIESDLAILKDLARIARKRVPSLAPFRPLEAVRELERSLIQELDFRNEAQHLLTFRRNFTDNPGITAPKPLPDFSGRRVLTMTYLEGVPVGDIHALDAMGADRTRLARRGADSVLRQVFEHRFFHADPHGGNILILPGDVVAFLDFGQVGSVLPSQRHFMADMLSSLIRMDAVRAVRTLLEWSGYRDPDVVRRLTLDMELTMERYLARPFGMIDLGDMVGTLFSMVRRYGIEIPANFYMLAKAMVTIEDIAGSLDPHFDFIRASRPFAKRMIRRELSPDHLAEQAAVAGGDAMRFLRDLPGDARDLMNLLKSGRMRMEFSLKDMRHLEDTVKRVITRLSAAILLASMIMGSSILVQSLIPPLVFGIPVIGILGFLFSGLVGIYLLVDLWRHH